MHRSGAGSSLQAGRRLHLQQLIEFGENEGLPGYAFKEFGGDRAVLGRAAIAYELPFLRAPLRVRLGGGRFRRVLRPGISPSITIGAQAGWAGATSPRAQPHINRARSSPSAVPVQNSYRLDRSA